MKRLKIVSILFLFLSLVPPQKGLCIKFEETQFLNTRVAVMPLRNASEKPTKPIKQSSFTVQALVWTLALFNVPSVMAREWTNYRDVHSYYEGGDCSIQRADQIMPAVLCLREGEGLRTCRQKIPSGLSFDLYEFTRHSSSDPSLDPVSMIRWKDHNVCFYTALRLGGDVTEVCFMDPKDAQRRSVKAVDKNVFSLHEGLERGKSIIHVGLDPSLRTSCGTFSTIDTNTHLGPHPTCILSAIAPQGDVTQLCFDPDNPSFLTLNKVDVIPQLPLHKDGSPVSLPVTDPGFLMYLGVKMGRPYPFEKKLKQGWIDFTEWCQNTFDTYIRI